MMPLRSFASVVGRSNDPTIGAEHLAIDPSAIRAREERHDGGDVRRLAEALKWCKLAQPFDELGRFSCQEKVRAGGFFDILTCQFLP
jgi:hypothetical protein